MSDSTVCALFCSVDATPGTNLCRLVNDAPPNQANCKMKLIAAANPSQRPRLCLFGLKDIPEHTELLYDYGDLPTNLWRLEGKVSHAATDNNAYYFNYLFKPFCVIYNLYHFLHNGRRRYIATIH